MKTAPAIIVGVVFLVACAPGGTNESEPVDRPSVRNADEVDSTMTIEEVLAQHTDAWMDVDGVEGTGLGLCDSIPCIKIFVSRPHESFAETLPESIDGYPVRLEPTGSFEVQ